MDNKNYKKVLSHCLSQSTLFTLGAMSVFTLLVFKITPLLFDSDLNKGFQHPLQGGDHLVTMIAIGIWASQLRGKAIWMLPLTFVSVMSLGGLAGAIGLALPSVETVILLSGLVFSVFIARRVKFSARMNILIVAFFAFFHGYVHGQEISASASLLSYTLGFVFATSLLHGTGIATARLITLAFAFFVGNNAYAQETEIPVTEADETTVASEPKTNKKGSLELKEVVVTAKERADSMVRIADSASQGHVGQAQLKYRPITRPAEVLETVPGLIATQHSGEGKANQYFLRGFNLDHGTDFLTQIEGVPINTVSHSHGQGWTDTNFLIPELIETLDYKKGNYYSENGDFSSTGSADIHYFRSLPENLVKYTGGSFDYHRGLVAGSHKLGDGNVLYAGETVHNNGPWTVGNQYWKFDGVLGYSEEHEDHGWSVTAMAMKSDWNSTDQIARRAVEQGVIGRFDALDPTDGGDSQRYSLTGEWHRQDSDSETKLMAYGLYSKLALFSNFTYFLDNNEFSNPTGCRGLNGLTGGQKFNPALFNTCGDQFGQPDERWTTGFKATHTFFHQLGDAESETTFGVQFRNDNIKNALTKTHAQQQYGVTREDQIWQSSLAGYVENKTRWLDWLRTSMGVRLDGFRFEVDGSNIAQNNGERYDGMVSPKLGIVFGPWADTEFYLNGGLGYHSNDARGINTTIDPVSRVDVSRADPLVRTYSAEIGARTTWVKGLQSTLAIWWLDIDSELIFVGDAGTTEAGRPSRRYGLEFANYYSPTDWLTFDADFSFSEARFRDDAPEGNVVPNSVETVIAAGATFHDVYGGFFGGPRVRYFGPRNLDESGTKKSDGTLLVSAVLGYEVNKNLSFQAEVYNILDRQNDGITYYYGSRLPGESSAGVDDFHFHPVEPLSFRMGFTAKF